MRMVCVSEEDCGKQGEGFEDIGLEDWNADMTKSEVGEVCQANGKGGPQQELYSSRYVSRSILVV